MTEEMREKVRQLKSKMAAELPILRQAKKEAQERYTEADSKVAHAEYQMSHLDNLLWGEYEPTEEEYAKIEKELKE